MIDRGPSDGQAAVILLAGGQSSRMTGIDKIWAEVAGKPVINYALDWLLDRDVIQKVNLAEVIIVARTEQQDRIKKVLDERTDRVKAPLFGFAPPGVSRQDSVRSGLGVVSDQTQWVLVHDGARPLVSIGMVLRVFSAAVKFGAAVPGIEVSDTVKSVQQSTSAGVSLVDQTLDRGQLRLIQTPQCFSYVALTKAHHLCEGNFTDDSAMIESLGGTVAVVEGAIDNIKVTYPSDLELVSEKLKTFDRYT
ncbi:MAG: 2-C-methyl-D-erythritol 4-phosphate cytidylyltransferase [Dehalococcoidia bacterium]|nr:2-C-methyl-D-erythritol 4-phosphate cytidylyltransferase [Dehalococcoidia bacterium]